MKKRNRRNKIYELIGRAVVFLTVYSSSVMFVVWSFNQMTVYK